MKRFLLSIICFMCCFSFPLRANEDLLKLLNLSIEIGDATLIKDTIHALLESEVNNTNLLDALKRYNEQGDISFSLHKAIMDKNLIAAMVLAYHNSKNINTRHWLGESVWLHQKGAVSSDSKTPLEIALEVNMKELIPYLLMKGADPYLSRKVSFLYEESEMPDYIIELGYATERKVCVKSQKAFYPIGTLKMSRTFIGDAIAKNRLDVLQLLNKVYQVDWNKQCCTIMERNISYTPLQFSLATKRYDIVQFLIDQGVRIN